ncbi:MAG TPA: M28 family peptidase, partial [Acidimicrobiales bacterium]
MNHHVDLLKHYADAVPSRNDMLAWITEVVDHGVRRPGTDAGHRVEDWVTSRFRYLGLQDVRREPLPVPVWEPGPARLVAWPADRPDETVELPGFPLPYTAVTGAEGVEADVVAMPPLRPRVRRGESGGDGGDRRGDGAGGAAGDDAVPEAVRGAIAVDVIEQGTLPDSYMRRVATRVHDPGGGLDGYEHLLPFGPRLGREVDRAVDAGAAAYVGVLGGMPWETNQYYVPYDAVDRDLPAVWVDRGAGARLAALLAAGPVRGRIEVEGRRREGQTCNVVGTLPGVSDEWVVVGSHHDAPWASAVEDGSGIAMVLAQARFWSQVPQAQRPHNMLFLL